jgi:hypothetical protein
VTPSNAASSVRRRAFAASPVLARRGQQRVAVVEEDVDPDPRVRAGDARHVAERAAGRRQGVVPVDRARARLRREQVRDDVRQMARERDEPVMRDRVDRDRPRADRRHHRVHLREPLRVGVVDRCQEVGRALEQLGAGRRGSARLRSADRVAADEPRAVGAVDPPHHVRLRRTDVGHGRVRRRRHHRRRDGGRQLRHRRAHHDELRVRAGLRDRVVGGRHAAALVRGGAR